MMPKSTFFKRLLGLLMIISINVYGQTTLPAFFSDGMVLQHSTTGLVWGKDNPNQEVTVTGSWGERYSVVTDSDGTWKVSMETPAAGGPFTMNIAGSSEIVINDILFGEVWFCSGQSNMQMTLKGYQNQPVIGSTETILNSSNDKIRQFHVERDKSVEPLDDVKGSWKKADVSTTGGFSAVAYYFAREIEKALDVPVGIIHSSWGGSNVEAWIPRDRLVNFPEVKLPLELPENNFQRTPTLLYNAMVHPFVGYPIKGYLWYQGESNRGNPGRYAQLFPEMIRTWRTLWNNDDLPFYFAQIAPFGYQGLNSAFLREVQLQVSEQMPHTDMAVTLDIGDCRNIHPPKKEPVGKRLAYLALVNDYGLNGIIHKSPVYESHEISGDHILIKMKHAPGGLYHFGNEISGFEIAGEDKVFHPAKVGLQRASTIKVWSEEVPNPVAVRYAFSDCPDFCVFNLGGLPASSFRTDDWNE